MSTGQLGGGVLGPPPPVVTCVYLERGGVICAPWERGRPRKVNSKRFGFRAPPKWPSGAERREMVSSPSDRRCRGSETRPPEKKPCVARGTVESDVVNKLCFFRHFRFRSAVLSAGRNVIAAALSRHTTKRGGGGFRHPGLVNFVTCRRTTVMKGGLGVARAQHGRPRGATHYSANRSAE